MRGFLAQCDGPNCRVVEKPSEGNIQYDYHALPEGWRSVYRAVAATEQRPEAQDFHSSDCLVAALVASGWTPADEALIAALRRQLPPVGGVTPPTGAPTAPWRARPWPQVRPTRFSELWERQLGAEEWRCHTCHGPLLVRLGRPVTPGRLLATADGHTAAVCSQRCEDNYPLREKTPLGATV